MTPQTIDQFLQQLREALAGADPALIQDALYDAEDHLRSAAAAIAPERWGEEFPRLIERYGRPEEVAAAYRRNDATVTAALAPPRPHKSSMNAVEKFFAVAIDLRAWTALFYLLLSLVTGIFLFVVVVVGLSLSLGLSILIFGIPVALGFIAMVRALSLAEGRLVEATLGVRMPRRPPPPSAESGLLARIKSWLVDARTWSTMLYMALRLPLGILYFTLMLVMMTLSLSLVASPIAWAFGTSPILLEVGESVRVLTLPLALLLSLIGLLGFFVTLHTARGLGWLHGTFAKAMLVRP